MPSSPLVSIIIPAYNGQQRIARAVKSVFAQDYTNWEIVIISDDMSDYECVLAVQGIRSDKIQFQSTGLVGSSAANARNVGLTHARGNIIALLDSDDEFHAQRLSRMLPLVARYGAAASNLKLIDDDTKQEIANISISLNDERLLPEQVFHRFFHAQSVVVFDRKKVAHTYMPRARYEDNIFLMQIYNSIDVIGYLHEPYYHYYKYKGASTSFSVNGFDVADAFLKSASDIKNAVLRNEIYFKSEELKQIMCASMDYAVEAQLFYIDKINTSEQCVEYNEIMKPFLEKCPLPKSLLAARQ